MAKGQEKSTPFDPMPDEWDCVLQKAFTEVTKFRGGEWRLAFYDIKQALADGRLPAAVRSLTDSRKWRELPIEFWQTARLSSSGPGHIVVRSDDYLPMDHCYFMRQRDVDKLCPVRGAEATRAPATPDTTDDTTAPPCQHQEESRSSKSLITAEVERRVAAGERYDNITPLSESLHEWMKTVSAKPLKPRSIENLLHKLKLWPLPPKK
jgi:hypothetical protein